MISDLLVQQYCPGFLVAMFLTSIFHSNFKVCDLNIPSFRRSPQRAFKYKLSFLLLVAKIDFEKAEADQETTVFLRHTAFLSRLGNFTCVTIEVKFLKKETNFEKITYRFV